MKPKNNVLKNINPKSILKFAKDLISAQSVTGKEKRGSKVIKKLLDAFGLEIQIDEVELGRSNLVGILKGEVGSHGIRHF